MLGRVLRRAIDAGVTEAVVNVHHLPQMIVDYLAANSNFGITIHVSHEDDLLLDTGGGLLAARRWLDGNEDILVHNADIFTDVDIRDMYRHHINSGSDVTLMAWKRDSSRALLIDKKAVCMVGPILPPARCALHPWHRSVTPWTLWLSGVCMWYRRVYSATLSTMRLSMAKCFRLCLFMSVHALQCQCLYTRRRLPWNGPT